MRIRNESASICREENTVLNNEKFYKALTFSGDVHTGLNAIALQDVESYSLPVCAKILTAYSFSNGAISNSHMEAFYASQFNNDTISYHVLCDIIVYVMIFSRFIGKNKELTEPVVALLMTMKEGHVRRGPPVAAG